MKVGIDGKRIYEEDQMLVAWNLLVIKGRGGVRDALWNHTVPLHLPSATSSISSFKSSHALPFVPSTTTFEGSLSP